MFKKIWLKIKESFQTAVVAAFIILMVIIILYIPFKIIPQMMSKGTSFIATTLSSLFISGDNKNTDKDKEDNKKTTEKEETKKTSTTNYYGNPDLSIDLIGTGFIDNRTGILYYSNEVGKDNIVGVKFQVKNTGTNISGTWRLRIVMPSKTTPEYISDYQISLRPGDRIEYTASFEDPTETGNINGYIVADYTNNVAESIESNNYLNIPFKIISTKKTTSNYSNAIKISCEVSDDTPETGDVVTWYANVNGGYGQILYSWQGSDGLLSIQSAANGVKKIYDTKGTKTAKVTINYNNQIYTKDCGSIKVK
jgi:hypothetical protein